MGGIGRFGIYRKLLPRADLKAPSPDEWRRAFVPPSIKRPGYASSLRKTAEEFPRLSIHSNPAPKTQSDIKILREAGRIAKSVMEEVCDSIDPGMTTETINEMGALHHSV